MNRRQFNKKILLGLASASLPAIINNKFTINELDRYDNFTPPLKKRILPKKLSQGDTIGLITPSSAASSKKIEKAINNIQSLGLKVKLGKYAKEQNGFLAGTDRQRIDDLHNMFADHSIDGIWCIRGGYGVGRILPYLNYKLIKKNPKVLIGYSDITALLHAIHLKTGLVCFHGPIASSDFTPYTLQSIKDTLFSPQTPIKISYAEDNEAIENQLFRPSTIIPGIAEGQLTGGNLTLMTSLAGTDFEWKMKNKIVFIEDIGEQPYRIDRMLTQLLQSTDIHKAAGIALGVFEDCESNDQTNSFSLMETIKERLAPLNIPTVYGLSFGHIQNHCTLPIGIKAKLDTERLEITLLEEVVK